MAALCGSGKPGWSERHSGSHLRKRSSASSRQLYYQLPLCHCSRVTLELYRKRTGATVSVSLNLRSSLSIQPFEGSRFVRGGRYGISIDFGLEVVEKESIPGTTFKLRFINLTIKPRLTIASS